MTVPTPAGPTDPFFAEVYDGDWNACIGRQGSDENYVDGYMEAALDLACAVIDKRQFEKRDTLALPILYNARHAVELSLKFAIRHLCDGGILLEPHAKNHDIASHWQMLAAAPHGDRDLGALIADLKPYVDSLHAIDEDGQQLRYSETQEGEQSLGDKSICNLRLIRRSLKLLSEILIDLKYRSIGLTEERRTGTFTNELSRRDLYRIAEMLPPMEMWRKPIFDETSEKIRRSFGLSSRKFSAAIHVIKKHREMAGMLGREFDLAYLTDAHANAVIVEWSKVHPPRTKEDEGIDYFDLDWTKIAEDGKIRVSAIQTVAATLSDEELADLEVIFYLGREPFSMCESYRGDLEFRLAIKKNDRNEIIDHILSRTNLLRAVVRGLTILGRRRLADELAAIRPDRVPS